SQSSRILVERARGMVAGYIAKKEVKFYTVVRQSSHPYKRTSSGNLWQQMPRRATESAAIQLIALAVDRCNNDVKVTITACHLTKVGKSQEFDDLVI
ncbi:MAG: hypothetical protein ACKPKO_39490, partial [Candidatus Fonsibacter sp.]